MVRALILTGLLAGSALAGEKWLTDFNKAKQIAAEKKLPILVDFSGSDWCGWCIKLDKEVFSQKEFQTFAQTNLVLFQADFPFWKKLPAATTEQNEKLAETYGVEGLFPTVLLLDADGKVIARTGYQPGGAAAYVAHLKELLNTQPKKK